MSEQIKPGDLVVVVKPSICCGRTVTLGMVFTAGQYGKEFGRCVGCGTRRKRLAVYSPGGRAVDVTRLKRIPPLDELEGEKRDEEIAA